jgi:hypothetical protein
MSVDMSQWYYIAYCLFVRVPPILCLNKASNYWAPTLISTYKWKIDILFRKPIILWFSYITLFLLNYIFPTWKCRRHKGTTLMTPLYLSVFYLIMIFQTVKTTRKRSIMLENVLHTFLSCYRACDQLICVDRMVIHRCTSLPKRTRWI